MTSVSEELAKEALELLHGTKQFVLSESPEYIKQLVWWESRTSGAWAIIGLVTLVLSIVAFSCWAHHANQNEGCWNDCRHGIVTLAYAAFFFGILSIPIAGINVNKYLKINNAPKVWLVDHFAELVQK